MSAPSRDPAARARAALAAVLAAGLALRAGIALARPSVLWFDELVETLEPAHRLAFGYGLVPWEFRLGTRSLVWPGALAAVMRPAAALGPGSFPYLAAVAVALSALSLAPVVAAHRWARPRGPAAALVAALAAAGWFELVYMAPKAFSEAAAGHLLLLALLLASEAGAGRRRLAGAGALLALAAALRLQLLPAAAVGALASPALRRAWRPALAGAVPVFLAAGAVDWATWGAPFASYVRSVNVNLLQAKASTFGVLPWWAYLEMLRRVWGWAGLLLVPLALAGARRQPAALAAALAVLLAHALVPHKEYRFVYPAVALLVTLAAVGTAEALAAVAAVPARLRRVAPALAAALWLAASAERARGFDNARTLADAPPGRTHWSALEHVLRVFRAASRVPMCGLALYRLPWTEAGGYAYLHQDVPMYEVEGAAELRRRAPAFDAAIGWAAPGDDLGPFRPERCVRGVCLWRRQGGCAPDPDRSLQRLLEARGE